MEGQVRGDRDRGPGEEGEAQSPSEGRYKGKGVREEGSDKEGEVRRGRGDSDAFQRDTRGQREWEDLYSKHWVTDQEKD